MAGSCIGSGYFSSNNQCHSQSNNGKQRGNQVCGGVIAIVGKPNGHLRTDQTGEPEGQIHDSVVFCNMPGTKQIGRYGSDRTSESSIAKGSHCKTDNCQYPRMGKNKQSHRNNRQTANDGKSYIFIEMVRYRTPQDRPIILIKEIRDT